MPKHHKHDKPHKVVRPISLLVGEHENPAANKPGRFVAERVEFQGREVATYEQGDITYTAYECAAYEYPAYRVYVSDETDPFIPRYSVRPYLRSGDHPRDYAHPFTLEELLDVYPMFAGRLGDFPVRQIDPDMLRRA